MTAVPYLLDEKRRLFHAHLLAEILTKSDGGVASNADKDSQVSRAIAAEILARIGGGRIAPRLKGQVAGRKFEAITHSFIQATFPLLHHLRPGTWQTTRINSRRGIEEVAKFDQYAHLKVLQDAARSNPQLAVALGSDYVIAPDIVVSRSPETDAAINAERLLLDPASSLRSPLRAADSARPILHASISCKWTIRSDRSQNSRSEGQNLVRNRKGRTPHIAVVTGEPLPSRISSIALGTGDIDCVYHFALDELVAATAAVNDEECTKLLTMMIEGQRLRDIAALPLDLAC